MTDSTFPAATAATALTGVEPFPSVQGGADVRVSAKQVADYAAPSTIILRLTGVNFNAANTDNPITVSLPTGVTRYMVSAVLLSKASASIGTATAGLFTAAAGGGVAVVTGGTTITVTATAANTNNNSMSFAVNNSATESYDVATLYFRTATAQGSAATADVIVHIRPLS